MSVCLSITFLEDCRSHATQTWWVGLTLFETRQDYVGLVTRVKGQLKFQIAPIELKRGESNPEGGAGMKLISRRVSSNVIWGQRSGQISNCSDRAETWGKSSLEQGGYGTDIEEGVVTCHPRSKVGSNFKLLLIGWNLRKVILDPGWLWNAYWDRGQPRSKVRSYFKLLPLSANLGKVMSKMFKVKSRTSEY